MYNHKKIKLVWGVICLVFAAIFVVIFSKPQSQIIFPGEIRTMVYSDTTHPDGKSEIISFEKVDDLITFSFVLRQGYPHPYAGFAIILQDYRGKHFDLSNFDYIKLTLSPQSPSFGIRIYIKSFIENFTDTLNYMTYRFLKYETAAYSSLLPLRNFSTPQWWYTYHKKTHHDFAEENFKNIYSIEFARSSLTPLDTQVTYLIEEISFVKQKNMAYIAIASAFLVASSILLLKKGKQSKIPSNNKEYKKIEVKNYSDEIWETISNHLNQNFSEFDIDLKKVSSSIGVGSSKISRLIKEKTTMNFREYLNNLRIEKAKNMLKNNKDMQIIDAAYSAGFSNISHFNRTFKEATKITPKKFKETH